MEAKQQVNRIAKNMIEYVYPPPLFKTFVGVVWLLIGYFLFI
jgi:hypothetical protein